MTTKKNKKVIVGLSGGVDSSVAALLLKNKGFSLTGVFMEFWGSKNRCCNPEAQKRARDVCRKLNIPFYVFDVKKEFKEKVVDYFIEGYKKGITPNPCVVCNKEIKFNFLIKKLSVLNADYIATGHYARIAPASTSFSRTGCLSAPAADSNLGSHPADSPTARPSSAGLRNVLSKENLRMPSEQSIYKGKDKEKDQSYFLWNIKREWLSKIIFPLGDLKKEEVKKIARENDFSAADVKESQEVCFVEKRTSEFLKKNIPSFPGEIVDNKGNTVGKHNGLFYYTIGQRKGLDLSGGPYYVLEKDYKKNKLVVTKEEGDLCKKELFYNKANFFTKKIFPFEAKAKIRYKGKEMKCSVDKDKVFFFSQQKAVTPGQSVVFYKGEELLGGGVIKK